ncbi:MAG: hypothetical protein ACLP1Y_07210 [Candidatus Acidiferrales bacterium]
MSLLWDIFILIFVVTTVSAWMTAYRMRRKVRKALGGKAAKADINSISTWMAVDEAKQRNGGNKPPDLG